VLLTELPHQTPAAAEADATLLRAVLVGRYPIVTFEKNSDRM
jgi:hypothetical protein